MDLLKYIGKRILATIVVLFGLSLIIFVLTRVVPGDPARMALGPEATQYAVDNLNAQLHTYDPLPIQYAYWIGGIFQGDFGISVNSKRDVGVDIAQFLPLTLELGLFAGIIMTLFSIVLGVLASSHKDRFVDTVIRILAYLGVSFPSFVVAVLILLIVGVLAPEFSLLGQVSVGMSRPPTVTGMMTVDNLLVGNPAGAWDAFKHLWLPGIALSLGGMFQQARIIRSVMLDTAQKEYVTLEKGYGLPSRTIVGKYMLKPSLIPSVAVLGMDFAGVLGGSFIIESVFNRSGLGRYALDALLTKDLNAISACVLVFGLITALMNIIVDLTVVFLDPRIRMGVQK
jgi:peptide/nickel transport system permease protein